MSKLEFDSNWSALSYDGERHLLDSAVLVLNGHTYHMVVDINREVNDVCKRCALQPLCFEETNQSFFRKLCSNCTPSGAGYWVEDRYPLQYTLEKICYNQNPCERDFMYACRTFDKPMFTHFEK